MNLFFNYDFERTFPFTVLNYAYTSAQGDLHLHDYLEIALCVEGRGSIVLPDRTIDIAPGDVIFFNRFFNHVVVSSQQGATLRLVLVLFLPALVDSVWLQHRDKALFEQFWSDMGEKILKMPADAPSLPSIRSIIRSIYEVYQKQEEAWQFEVDGRLKLLLSASLRYYLALQPNVPAIDHAVRAKFQPVLNYIEAHSAERIGVKELSEIVHLSESQFRHNFKLATNRSFTEYITHIRMIHAIHLLISSDIPVQSLAATAGFSNLNHFYRLFRQITAMSPAEYRRRNQGGLVLNNYPLVQEADK